ncbi:MAG: 30S ribosomal protein S16 [candidate division NC10 bacterium]|nr:30S ribosomal protein S16 [candidate division NC10 bacterium]MBI4841954.1 30S ribosomal protein S16 [candidate division NC10 bacterium]
MAVKIRLRRMGTKQTPFYRLVVADSRAARDGRFLESLGTYDPLKHPIGLAIDADKALGWLQRGAQPTDTVRQLLSKAGVMRRFAELRAKPPATS